MSASGFSFSQAQLREIATDLIRYARQQGASACEAEVSEGFGQSVGVRMTAVDTIEYNRDKGVGVTVYIGQQRGYASTSDLAPAALRATVDAALSIARFTAADDCAGLADASLMADESAQPELDLFHPWQLEVDEAIALAKRCEEAAFAVSPSIRNSEGASVSVQQGQFAAANSHGFVGGYATTRHSVSCSVIAGAGDAMQREYWYDVRRDANELDHAEEIGRIAGERALARLDARQLPTGELPVLFEAPLAASLISNFVHAVSGGALYRKASFLLDSLGKAVFSPIVHIDELPHLPKGLASRPFDSDGVATSARSIVADGVVNAYFLSAYSARKLGMQTTANAGGAHNLVVRPGEQDLAGLIRQMDRGLLVTELLGQGVNYVTGDYSRGAAGFWVEHGEIQHAVEEITIAGNLAEMLAGIVAIGNDALPRAARQCGSLLIERMKVAGS